ncbi:hypothetical protein ACS0TY_011374 [Phlomoides rotata]
MGVEVDGGGAGVTRCVRRRWGARLVTAGGHDGREQQGAAARGQRGGGDAGRLGCARRGIREAVHRGGVGLYGGGEAVVSCIAIPTPIQFEWDLLDSDLFPWIWWIDCIFRIARFACRSSQLVREANDDSVKKKHNSVLFEEKKKIVASMTGITNPR